MGKLKRWRSRTCDRTDMYRAALEYVNAPNADQQSLNSQHFPSCTWRGYYRQYYSRHNLCSFDLHFCEDTSSGLFRIDGTGQDDIGVYVIDGEWNPRSRRMAFVKEYELGSQTTYGRVDWRENKGHRVLYKGRAQREPGQGFKGTWSLDVN